MLSKIKSFFAKPRVRTAHDFALEVKLRELNLKFASANFKRVVCWNKRMVWVSKKGRMVKYSKADMPVLGFNCSGCETLGHVDHYLIDDKNYCEDCTVKVVETMKQIAGAKSKKGVSVPEALLE